MANEVRLIDAKPLMENGWHLVKTGKSNEFLGSMSLADVPTVSAVEVVRCKDCESYHFGRCWNGACVGLGISREANDFCSYGERREGE